MRSTTLHLKRISEPVCHQVWLAQNFHQRLRGLLFRPPLRSGEGLFLANSTSIHTIGMGYPLDVVFLDRDLTVTGVQAGLLPRRFALSPKGTRHAIELAPGTIHSYRLAPGDQLLMQ